MDPHSPLYQHVKLVHDWYRCVHRCPGCSLRFEALGNRFSLVNFIEPVLNILECQYFDFSAPYSYLDPFTIVNYVLLHTWRWQFLSKFERSPSPPPEDHTLPAPLLSLAGFSICLFMTLAHNWGSLFWGLFRGSHQPHVHGRMSARHWIRSGSHSNGPS